MKKNINLDRKQIIELYLCLGGVAKYLTYLERGKSVPQLIGELCFSYNAPLIAEFHKLYRSLFDDHDEHVKIVKALAKTRTGLSYQQLVQATHLSSGGTLSKRIEELKQSGFIAEIPLFAEGEKSNLYVLIDEYSLFYLTWQQSVSSLELQHRRTDYWLKQRNKQAWKIWTGHAFECLCLKHIESIKAALGLAAVQTTASKWNYKSTKHVEISGANIDLVIDRADDSINLCEIKFYNDPFIIDKKYSDQLRKKRECFEQITQTRKSTFITLMTTYGVKHNEYYFASIDQELEMDSLFIK